jgi:hypothetical protein
MWNPTTNDVRPIPTAATPPAAQPAVTEYQYGSLSVEDYAEEEQNPGVFGGNRRDKNFVWLDFPQLDKKQVGGEVFLLVRLLPPWASGLSRAHVKCARHRIYAQLVPGAPVDREAVYIDCHDSIGGPGNCPIDAARNQLLEHAPDANDFVDRQKARAAYYWQGIDLMEPTKHYVQVIDPSSGQPAVNPDGSPVYKIIPAVIRVGSMTHKEILKYIREKGDPTHIDHGYSVKLIKRRDGMGRFDVKYSAIDVEHGPLHESLRPVLANLVNLQQDCIDYRPRAELEAIGQNMLRRYGLGGPEVAAPAAGWLAHPQQPGWEYNAQGQVRQIQAPAPPPMAAPAMPPAAPQPPAMPPTPPTPQVAAPVPAAPPAAPQGLPAAVPAPPSPAAPQAAPANLPPPVAPGGVPAAPVTGVMPPGPPPPPGLPPSIQGPPEAPPPPPSPTSNGGGSPATGVSPEAFEEQLAKGNPDQGKLPF